MSHTPAATATLPAWVHRSEAFAEDLPAAADTLPARPALRPVSRLLACALPICLALSGALVSTFAQVV